MELAEGQLTEQLAAVLGPEAGQELVAALRDANVDGDEEDIFGAFWRSVLSSPFANTGIEGQNVWSPKNALASPKAGVALPAIAEENGRGRSDVPYVGDATNTDLQSTQGTIAFRDNASLLQERG